jgi:hypothetical protein
MSSPSLRAELRANFKDFGIQWQKELKAAATKHKPLIAVFQDSYIRIASIQAWRTSVTQAVMDEDSAAFFFEAQNDLLVSHCLARCGSFRQALKSLRSGIENVFFSLYYMDHPVERRKWLRGQHKIGFSELHSYLVGHPDLSSYKPADVGLDALSTEYATLSKAVHSSAKHFRMTTDLSNTRLWVADTPAVGKWATRERSVIGAMNLLLVHLFAHKLTGAQNRALREMLGLVLAAKKKTEIKQSLKVTLPS